MNASCLQLETTYFHTLEWAGSGTPIVLLHGLGSNALSWNGLARSLSGRNLVSIDLPGHGQSPVPADWHLGRLAETLWNAVHKRYGKPVIWIGHSWGAKTAALIGATYAARAVGLIEPSPAQALPVPMDYLVDEVFGHELKTWPSLEEALEGMRQFPHYRRWNDSVAEAVRRGIHRRADGSWGNRLDRQQLIALATAVLGTDYSAQIATLHCPTLLLMAQASLPWQKTTNMAIMPRAKQLILPGQHWLYLDNPEGVQEAVWSWLQEVCPL